ncbi:rho GTPase-activating protein 12-like isoform X2 [Rhodnius prolixus]|uniref:rho GTPase-activating protein 12-like isoform X2 n=1 Tax=Rhodnius prolixus TaxID=13249 RepID=UPI003D18E1ED
MEVHDTNVEVLYDFEYSTKEGQKISIREGEKLLLLKKTNEDWWQVIRSNGRRPFYVPSTYVRELGEGRESLVLECRGDSPPKNFTVSVNVKQPEQKFAKTKVMLNCDELSNPDKLSARYGRIPVVQYATDMAKKKGDIVAEANILDDNLSSSLAELAKEIEFRPRQKKNSKLKYVGSFKVGTEEKKKLTRSFSSSTPDLTATDNDKTKSNHTKSVEQLPDLENNVSRPSKTLHEVTEKLQRNMARFLCSYGENNNLKDSSDSVGSGGIDSTVGASSSESIDKTKVPQPKPRKTKPVIQESEEVIYANCLELAREAAVRWSHRNPGIVPSGNDSEPPTTPPVDLPTGWSTHVDTETQLTSYVHSATGDRWHSANDGTGRVYFFRENSSESSWTLPNEPSHSCSQYNIQELPPNPQQMSEELTAIFSKISNVELSARRQRATKAYSLIVPNKKDELDINLKWPPHLSDGKMHVVCEGPLHYTKISEAGKRVRKNWNSAYVVLSDLFLFIYKDMKAFHSHKSPPEVTVELQGAEVGSGEKVSGRKHVLLVGTPQGLQLALQCDNINSVLHWATTIQHTVKILPKMPTPEMPNSKLGSIAEGPTGTDEGKKGTSINRSKSVNYEPVFGCYLDQACGGASHSTGVGKVPLFVQRCVSLIESSEENMQTDGLYRASGNLSQIQKIRLQIDQNNYTALEREEDVHVLTGALKLFFRELKEPLIPYKQFTKAIKASTTTNKKERLNMFVDIVKSLPTANRDTLKFLLQHLLKVTKYQEHNRMHMANVAIVFGPTLMWPEQESQNMALDLIQQNMVIEALLIDYHLIFK